MSAKRVLVLSLLIPGFLNVPHPLHSQGTITPPSITIPFCAGKPNGTACDDGNRCTRSDTCQGGVCVGSNPMACAALDQCHVAGTCSPATGVCSNPIKANGTACNDGNVCTQTDACQSGACSGTLLACPAPNQCMVGSCNPATGLCVSTNKPNGTACIDGNACTQNDLCQNGACSGIAVVCNTPGPCHVTSGATCNSATGACFYPNAPNGTACGAGQSCLNGACQ